MSSAIATIKNAAKTVLAEQVPDRAAALAYYGFLAVPSLLLLTLGVVGVVTSPGDIGRLLQKGGDVMPPEAITLLDTSIGRLSASGGGGVLIGTGAVLALWSGTGAMSALIRALNAMYGITEARNPFHQRLVALGMLVWTLFAVVLVVGLLVVGPVLSHWLGDAVNHPGLVDVAWSVSQWPLLIGGIMLSFAGLLSIGPNRVEGWRLGTLGAVVATALWLLISAGFAFYTNRFGGFGEAWGPLAAVVVTLMWLWLSSIALLLGAAIDAETAKTRDRLRADDAPSPTAQS